MAKKDTLTKSKSFYTIRSKHQTTSNGDIFENDYTTIYPNDDIYDDEAVLFSDSNFKFKVRTEKNNKKKHTRGGWIKNGDSEEWTFGAISAHTKSDEYKIVNKPNYSSIKDFAYYGSAVELLHATMNDIILRFPGGLYYTGGVDKVTVGNKTYYLVSNEFEIDCWSNGNIFSGDVKNPMRVLSSSYHNYVNKNGNEISQPVITMNGSTCTNSIIGEVTIDGKKFYIYKDKEEKKHLLTTSTSIGTIIVPKEEIRNKFWETLDDFERVLLNRETNPVYKATFETPFSDEDGFFYKKKNYIWPTVNNDGFTPDMSSAAFQVYLNSLIELASFHDEYDSDNIWRMLTHEAIKNLDWTFIRSKDGETEDLSDIDSSKMKAMLRIYGRQFDDLKRYADNVKATNNISYDGKNNVPDYFLSDILENKGWEAKNVAPFDSNLEDDLYVEKTPSEINSEFARRLALNSSYIHSLKGTRRGIEAILGLFGYKENEDYTLSEYVSVATKFPKYDDFVKARSSVEYLYADENSDFLDGYPVRSAEVYDNNGDFSTSYLVPYYVNGQSYDYPLYYEMKGGWGKQYEKDINLTITDVEQISQSNGINIYDETETYLRYANTVDEMTEISNAEVFENMVCYVTDITGLSDIYTTSSSDRMRGNDNWSHYFILKNTELSTRLGFVENEKYSCYGWKNIYESELKANSLSEDGKRVIYLESLESNFKGNNPHIGYGNYDGGSEYIERLNRLFGPSIDDGKYDYYKDSTDTDDKEFFNKVDEMGFGINKTIKDNSKCHYFWESETNEPTNGHNDTFYNQLTIPSYISGATNKHLTFACDSVINRKRLVINFTHTNRHFKDYVKKVVLTYLNEMIPSTTILEYTFGDEQPYTFTSYNSVSDNSYNIVMGHAADVTDDDDRLYLTEADVTEKLK